jgi:hypothetical protein
MERYTVYFPWGTYRWIVTEKDSSLLKHGEDYNAPEYYGKNERFIVGYIAQAFFILPDVIQIMCSIRIIFEGG